MGQNLRDWNIIVSSFSLTELNLQDSPDVFKRSLHSMGQFSVKSMYATLVNNDVRILQEIWRAKMPMKIKIFMCYLKRDVILTKDNLVRRNWNEKNCSSYHINESIQHLFFECAYASFLWRGVHLLFGIPRSINIHELFNQ